MPSTPSCSTRPAAPRASCAVTRTMRWLRRAATTSPRWRAADALLEALWLLLAPGGAALLPPVRSSGPRAGPDRRVFATRRGDQCRLREPCRPAICCRWDAGVGAPDGSSTACSQDLTSAPATPGFHDWSALRADAVWWLALFALLVADEPAGGAAPDLAARCRRNSRLTAGFRLRAQLELPAPWRRSQAACRCISWPRPRFRDRWYWRDERIASASRVWRIVYQPLTSNYRVTFGGAEPELRHAPRPGRDPARRELEDRRRWGRSRRTRATTSSSASASTPRCCRGRCRSASPPSPTGRCRSSACSASIDPASQSGLLRHDQGETLGLDRRPGGATGPALVLAFLLGDQQPGGCERHYVWLFWVNVTVAALLLLVVGIASVRLVIPRAAAQFGSRLLLAGGDLRAGRRAAGPADLHGQLPVRRRAASRAGST